jgi:3-phosphoshikimate 1-carboxyvinyltransferase
LLAAPASQTTIDLLIDGPLVSRPYVEMTLAVMRAFGAQVEVSDSLDRFTVVLQPYRATKYAVEPDASAASYFWASAAVTGGEVTVEGLSRQSLQGDVAFVDCLEQMGCTVQQDANSITVFGRELHGIDVDMNGISDTVQTLSVVALFAKGSTRIRNVAHIRYKETDRIAAVAAELRTLGATVIEHEDGLTIEPGELHGASIETYNDHRMAMSFALAGLRVPGVRIANSACVEKTYPGFYSDLGKLINSSG